MCRALTAGLQAGRRVPGLKRARSPVPAPCGKAEGGGPGLGTCGCEGPGAHSAMLVSAEASQMSPFFVFGCKIVRADPWCHTCSLPQLSHSAWNSDNFKRKNAKYYLIKTKSFTAQGPRGCAPAAAAEAMITAVQRWARTRGGGGEDAGLAAEPRPHRLGARCVPSRQAVGGQSPAEGGGGGREQSSPLEGARRPSPEDPGQAAELALSPALCGGVLTAHCPALLCSPPAPTAPPRAGPRSLGHSGQPSSAPSVVPGTLRSDASSMPPSVPHSRHFFRTLLGPRGSMRGSGHLPDSLPTVGFHL